MPVIALENTCYDGRTSVAEVRQHGDRLVLSFEVKPKPSDVTPAVIAGSKRALEQAWARV